MKYKILSLLMLSSALLANSEVTTVSEFFSEAKTSGNIRYYYIQTDKEHENATDTSAYANSVGGQLSFDTASLYGFSSGVTFMTTNPFLLGPNVDTSIIGKDNGVRVQGNPSGTVGQTSFSVLGEGYLAYNYKDFGVSFGRKVIKTPLIHAKDVRMLPSAVQGAFGEYAINKKSKVEIAYLDKFKQRTSDRFINIVNHALGTKTQTITGSTNGSVVMAGIEYKEDSFTLKTYDYYAGNFMNSFYIDGTYNHKFDGFKMRLAAQYINQVSIGNADEYFKNNVATYGGAINSNAIGAKMDIELSSAKFTLAYSNVLKDDSSHDSLVTPWDGTPLFAGTLTSNSLFQSLYGNALTADSTYIGGSQSINFVYAQKYDGVGLKGFSSKLLYMNINNEKFAKNQQDYNIILAYKYTKAFSLAFKGIWSQNASGVAVDGSVTQVKLLSQYRVITNYKF